MSEDIVTIVDSPDENSGSYHQVVAPNRCKEQRRADPEPDVVILDDGSGGESPQLRHGQGGPGGRVGGLKTTPGQGSLKGTPVGRARGGLKGALENSSHQEMKETLLNQGTPAIVRNVNRDNPVP